MTAQELIDALQSAGYEWREYSGRGMMGARCVGVELDNERDIWKLSRDLIDYDIRSPRIDSMGLGIIVYWPRIKIEEDAVPDQTTGAR